MQLVVSGPADLTHDPATRYEALDPDIARVDDEGLVHPVADGVGRIVVRSNVLECDGPRRRDRLCRSPTVSFAGSVVPIF